VGLVQGPAARAVPALEAARRILKTAQSEAWPQLEP